MARLRKRWHGGAIQAGKASFLLHFVDDNERGSALALFPFNIEYAFALRSVKLEKKLQKQWGIFRIFFIKD